ELPTPFRGLQTRRCSLDSANPRLCWLLASQPVIPDSGEVPRRTSPYSVRCASSTNRAVTVHPCCFHTGAKCFLFAPNVFPAQRQAQTLRFETALTEPNYNNLRLGCNEPEPDETAQALAHPLRPSLRANRSPNVSCSAVCERSFIAQNLHR